MHLFPKRCRLSSRKKTFRSSNKLGIVSKDANKHTDCNTELQECNQKYQTQENPVQLATSSVFLCCLSGCTNNTIAHSRWYANYLCRSEREIETLVSCKSYSFMINLRRFRAKNEQCAKCKRKWPARYNIKMPQSKQRPPQRDKKASRKVKY